MALDEKRCTKCGAVKPLSEFRRDRQKADGFYSSCKLCKNASTNPDWPSLSKERQTAATMKWRKKNAERHLETKRKWTANNRERIRAQQRRYFAENREHYLAKLKAAFAARRGGGRREKTSQILALMKLQRGKCAICRTSISKRYELDHIIPIKLGGPSIIENYQLLCPPCNRSKSCKHPVDFMQSKGMLL